MNTRISRDSLATRMRVRVSLIDDSSQGAFRQHVLQSNEETVCHFCGLTLLAGRVPDRSGCIGNEGGNNAGTRTRGKMDVSLNQVETIDQAETIGQLIERVADQFDGCGGVFRARHR